MMIKTHFHYGRPSGRVIGSHAMVLVGHRKDDTGKQFFLIQNWWFKKQFLEFDADYLIASGASISLKHRRVVFPNHLQ
jgi:hypothetical protein